MAKKIEFSREEIDNAISIFNELSISFEKDNDLFLKFKSSPISFLRKSGLLIMKYINNKIVQHFLNRFSSAIRYIISFKDFFDLCSWCKIMTLTIIYALTGKAKLTIDSCFNIISNIIEAVKNILNLSNEMVGRLLKKLNSINGKLSLYRLAILICQQLGHCPF